MKTPNEILEACDHYAHAGGERHCRCGIHPCHACVQLAIRAAVAAEREACAQILDRGAAYAAASTEPRSMREPVTNLLRGTAAAIRVRGGP